MTSTVNHLYANLVQQAQQDQQRYVRNEIAFAQRVADYRENFVVSEDDAVELILKDINADPNVTLASYVSYHFGMPPATKWTSVFARVLDRMQKNG